MTSDKYDILGVPRTATTEQIREAYLRLARTSHPDLNPGNEQAESHFKAIQLAYEILVDPVKRRDYDLGGQVPSTVVYAEEFWQSPEFYWPEHDSASDFHLVRRSPLTYIQNGVVAILCLAILGSVGYGIYWMSNSTARAAAVGPSFFPKLYESPPDEVPTEAENVEIASLAETPAESLPSVGGIPITGGQSMEQLLQLADARADAQNADESPFSTTINLDYWESKNDPAMLSDKEIEKLNEGIAWGDTVTDAPLGNFSAPLGDFGAPRGDFYVPDFSVVQSPSIHDYPTYSSPTAAVPSTPSYASLTEPSQHSLFPNSPLTTTSPTSPLTTTPATASLIPASTIPSLSLGTKHASLNSIVASITSNNPSRQLAAPSTLIPDTSLAPQMRQGRATIVGQNAEFFAPTPRSNFSSLNTLSTSLPEQVLSSRLRNSPSGGIGGNPILPQLQNPASGNSGLGSQSGYSGPQLNGTYSSPGMSVIPSTPTFPMPSFSPGFQPVN